jgi:hypothetical protein
MIISVLTRRLREGRTLEDFRAAWERQGGFGVPTRVVTGQGLDDPREIVTIGFSDLEVSEIEAFLARTAPEEARRRDRIAEVIEPEMTRAFYLQVADDDLS